jgi:nucleotide-binding universal stress UspA family protein
VATGIIFEERFFDGAWTYVLFIPALYFVFTRFRNRLGPPKPLDDHLGRFIGGQYLLPFQRHDLNEFKFGIERILVPLDGSALAEHALPVAELLARTTSGSLHLVSVRPAGGGDDGATDAPATDIASYLDRMAWSLGRRGLVVGTSIRSGSIPDEIGRLGDELHTDIIVMAHRSGSPVDRLLGRSVAIALVRKTERPVLILRPTDAWPSRATAFQKLLVCLDGSQESEEVLPWVRILARQFGSRIVLLTVPEDETEIPRLEQYLGSVADALRGLGLTAEIRVTGLDATGTITGAAATEGCDLIMMATRGRGAPEDVDAEVGSVTDRVVQSAPCPVFAVTVLGIQAGRVVGFEPSDGKTSRS